MKAFKIASIFILVFALVSASTVCADCRENGAERLAELSELVNRCRAENGLSPLRLDGVLCRAARFKAEEIAETGRFSHESAIYGSPEQMLKRFGADFRCVGENIALGYENAASVMADWMSSSGHRANILCRKFSKLGLGFDRRFGVWVQIFTD